MTRIPRGKSTFLGRVGDVQPDQIDSLVSCHESALPTDVMTMMGHSFLRARYRFYQHHPQGICLTAVDEKGRVAGFVVGAPPAVRRQFLRRHFLHTFWRMASGSLTDSRIRARFTGAMRGAVRKALVRMRLVRPNGGGSGGGRKSIVREPEGHYVVLLTLGARPDCRGQGVGKALTRAFAERCRELGFDAAYLMTKCDNQAANSVYQKAGWELVAARKGFNHYRLEIRQSD